MHLKLLHGCLLLVGICMTTTHAYVALGYFVHPSYPNKCYIDERTILEVGEVATLPGVPCSKITCYENSFAETATCGIDIVEKSCVKTTEMTTTRPATLSETRGTFYKTNDAVKSEHNQIKQVNYPDCCLQNYKCPKLNKLCGNQLGERRNLISNKSKNKC